METGPDIVIIGSGIGGATVAAALAPSGRRIVILERGERLADCPEARDAEAIFGRGHFRPKEEWQTPDGEAFNPGNYYYVGGNSKLYGAVLIRYRAEDFRPLRHLGGTTPGWPVSYDEMESWYQRAEEALGALPVFPGAGRAEHRRPARPVAACRGHAFHPAARPRSRRMAQAGRDPVGCLPRHHRGQERRRERRHRRRAEIPERDARDRRSRHPAGGRRRRPPRRCPLSARRGREAASTPRRCCCDQASPTAPIRSGATS